jgi:hypothetical protein
MAHKKGVGSSKNGRESESKRLGVKIGVRFSSARPRYTNHTTRCKNFRWPEG